MTSPPLPHLAVALGVALLLAPAPAPGAAVLKIATLAPQGSAWHGTLQELAQSWQRLAGGSLTVRLYAGGVAGDDGDVVRKMRLGTLDGGVLTSAGLVDIDRSANALSVPLVFDSYAEFDAVAATLQPELEKLYEAKGFVVLGWADAGWVHLFTKSPAPDPAALRKLKLFTWGADSDTAELWRSAGFNPVPLPSTEISTALQTGLVSALPTTPQAAVLLQWFQQAPYMTDLPWAVLAGGIVLTRAGWEKVPADLRPAFAAAARTAAARLTEQTRSGVKADREAMVRRGLTVVPVDATAAAAWREVAVAMYPKLRGGFAPAELFDRALALRDAWRQREGRR